MPVPHPTEFRQRAVELARLGERQVREIAQSLGISESCLRNWIRQDEIDTGARPGLNADERRELVELRRDKRRSELENEILKRAAAYFARENVLPKRSTRWCGSWPMTESPSRSPAGCWACRLAGFYDWRDRPISGRERSDLQLVSLIHAAADPAVRVLAPIVDAADPESLMAGLGGLVVDAEGWAADLAQLTDAWNSFADDVEVTGRTFGNFRQHLFRAQRGNPMAAGVRILTVHKAQGREFTAVALVACNDGQFPDFRATTQAEKEAELRTFYVAASRASRALLFTRAAQRDTRYGYARPTEPSPYLRLVAA